MKRVLGKKQSSKHNDWLNAMKNIEALISREEIESKTLETIAQIREVTAGKTVAYAWSGGKDSLVLGRICETAGIPDCMMGICEMEYPQFMEWIDYNRPEYLQIINTGQDLEWLAKHPEMLFPKDSKTASRWFQIVQHKAQAKYYREHNLDMIVLGRRRADGNYCGKGSNIYTDGKGVTRYSPLADWTHEEILGYIHYFGVEMPPIYEWEKGYLCGTHPWPARQWTGSEENGWKEVWKIDHTIVEKAASVIPGAKAFLEKHCSA